jgi:hypothetical protein
LNKTIQIAPVRNSVDGGWPTMLEHYAKEASRAA